MTFHQTGFLGYLSSPFKDNPTVNREFVKKIFQGVSWCQSWFFFNDYLETFLNSLIATHEESFPRTILILIVNFKELSMWKSGSSEEEVSKALWFQIMKPLTSPHLKEYPSNTRNTSSRNFFKKIFLGLPVSNQRFF